jgi:hypothetical protein
MFIKLNRVFTLGRFTRRRVTTVLGITLLCLGGPAAATASEGAEKPAGYLFAHMMKEDYGRLYYSISTDGLHWTLLNQGRRVFNDYRGHPDLMRGHDGRWVLTGNPPNRGDVRFWVSTNLVIWTHLRDFVPDMSAFPGYEGPDRWHGAPKLFYDEVTRQYLLTWHFSNAAKLKEKPENYWSGMKTFRVTSPDLVAFAKAERLFAFDLATIDVIVRREGGKYFAILKDERYPSFEWPTGKTIRISEADRLLGPYPPPGPPVSPNFREAPALIPRPDGQGWYLYFEQYPGLSYLPATAPKIGGPWHDVYAPDCKTPEGARHGCMFPLGKSEFDAIMKAFGTGSPPSP